MARGFWGGMLEGKAAAPNAAVVREDEFSDAEGDAKPARRAPAKKAPAKKADEAAPAAE